MKYQRFEDYYSRLNQNTTQETLVEVFDNLKRENNGHNFEVFP